MRANFGKTEIEVPQDCNGTFEPKSVKNVRRHSGIEQKIISLYAIEIYPGSYLQYIFDFRSSAFKRQYQYILGDFMFQRHVTVKAAVQDRSIKQLILRNILYLK